MIKLLLNKAKRYYGLDKPKKKENNKFSFLYKVKPNLIADFIGYEHPQTIAVIISHLDKNIAALILQNLQKELSAEIIMRISKMGPISHHIIDKIANNLENRLNIILESKSEIGGANTAHYILKEMDTVYANDVLNDIEQIDAELSLVLSRRQ
jgi:flagellar motor switch protein FliG